MLIKSIDEIREMLPISTANDYNRLKPHLENAERDYLVPAIGANMMLELNEFADNLPEGTLTDVQESMMELYKLAKISLVHLAYWIGYDTLNAYISDGGFHRLESEKVRSLFKYQEDNIRDYFKVTGFNGLDAMLALMEATPEHFAEYFASDDYKKIQELFVPNTASFDAIYFIGNSRLIFMRLVPYMKMVEYLHIKPLLGTTNFTELKAAMLIERTAKVNAIVPLIQKPVALLATALLMEDSGAELTDRGLFFIGKAAGSLDNAVRTPTEATKANNMAKRNRGIGESYMSALKTYLLEHATDWNNYAAPKGQLPNRDNTGKKSVWV